MDAFDYSDEGQLRVQIVDCKAPAIPAAWSFFGSGYWPDLQELTAVVDRSRMLAVRSVPEETRHLNPPLDRITAYTYMLGRVEAVSKPDGTFDFEVAVLPDRKKIREIVYLKYNDAQLQEENLPDGTPAVRLSFGRAGEIVGTHMGKVINQWRVEWNGADSSNGVYLRGNRPSREAGDVCSKMTSWDRDDWSHVTNGEPVFPCPAGPGSSSGRLAAFTYTVLAREFVNRRGSRVVLVDLLAPPNTPDESESQERKAAYTDFGLVGKTVDPTGTIARTISNPLGQILAEFEGTVDQSPCWQNVTEEQLVGGTGRDNMVMTKRHWYGEGIYDIRQRVHSRHYRSTVRSCVAFVSELVELQAGGAVQPGAVSADDVDVKFVVDRRGRRVLTESIGAAGTLRASANWSDHLGRSRWSATMGPTALAAMFADAGVTGLNPSERDILKFGEPQIDKWRALSQAVGVDQFLDLTETLYNERGLPEETRTYDMSVMAGGGLPRYVASRQYHDHAGRVTYMELPGGEVVITVFNALGSEVASVRRRGDDGVNGFAEVEVVRTQRSSKDLPEIVSRVVRTIDSSSPPSNLLSLLNGDVRTTVAVRVDELRWYDLVGRLVATAQLGTGSSDHVFANSTSGLPVRPTDANRPVWNDETQTFAPNPLGGWPYAVPLSRARVTLTDYDKAGRVTAVRSSNGALETVKYDGLGRVVERQLDGPIDQDGNAQQQLFAYNYSDGQLKHIATAIVQPSRNTSGRIIFARPAAVCATGSVSVDPSQLVVRGPLQTTTLIYGNEASICGATQDANGFAAAIRSRTGSSSVSQNFNRLARIVYPRGGCPCDLGGVNGVIDVPDIFAFLQLWFEAVDPRADFNGNGAFDVPDIFAFLACWFSQPDCRTFDQNFDYQYQYGIDGTLLGRTDANGVTLSYVHDALNRVSSVQVVPGSGSPAPPAVDQVEKLVFTYDLLDRMLTARAESRNWDTQQSYVVSESAFAYDGFGGLKREDQARPGMGAVRSTGYSRLYLQGGGTGGAAIAQGLVVPRLVETSYPFPRGNPVPGAESTRIQFGYGMPGSWNDTLHRVESISAGYSGNSKHIVDYSYFGAAGRLGLAFGKDAQGIPSVEQTFRSDGVASPSLSGLSSFGEVRDLHYTSQRSGQSVSLRRGEYRYDSEGNPTCEIIDRSNGAPASRSWMYGFDGLNRIQAATQGAHTIDSQGQAIAGSAVRKHSWHLDQLGNWFNAAEVNASIDNIRGFRVDLRNSQGNLVPSENKAFRPNARNELRSVQNWTRSGQNWSSPGAVDFAYDACGRLVFDGPYVYRYDGFGRLVQVNRSGGVILNDTGQLTQLSNIGELVVHYSYDALGRLIRTQRPEDPTNQKLAVTDVFYDGVRIVQDVVLTGVPRGDVQSQVLTPRAAFDFGDHDGDQSTPLLSSRARLAREYVWAAGPTGYVDECHAQLVYTQAAVPSTGESAVQDGPGNDVSPTILYCLNDLNSSVVGLATDQGVLAARYEYAPFGQVLSATYAGVGTISADERAAAEGNQIGHQGLRFDRLDRPWSRALDAADVAGSAFGTHAGVYQNRNRSYMPTLGRFLQRDPNATGQPVAESAVFGGGAFAAELISGLRPLEFHRDGGNLHAFVGGNAFGQDPSGLFGLGSIGIGTSSLGGLQQDHSERVLEAGGGLKAGAGRMLRAAAVFQFMDADWALDWSSSDYDYFGSGLEAGFYDARQPRPQAATFDRPGEEMDIAAALLTPADKALVDGLAGASRHGGLDHRRGMGALAIEMIEDAIRDRKISGLDDLDLDRMFNKSHPTIKTLSGKSLRPDVLLVKKVGNVLLNVGEVAYSQSTTQLNNRIKMFLNWGFTKPGRSRL